jgi:hypothetical protein
VSLRPPAQKATFRWLHFRGRISSPAHPLRAAHILRTPGASQNVLVACDWHGAFVTDMAQIGSFIQGRERNLSMTQNEEEEEKPPPRSEGEAGRVALSPATEPAECAIHRDYLGPVRNQLL